MSVIQLARTIPGDADALVDVEITTSGGSAAPIWALIGWWRRPGAYNLCWNGDFESLYLNFGGTPLGWSVASVTNLNSGAATSITRLTTAGKYGISSGQIVAPASADRGASFRMFRRFKKGVTYTAEAWIHSAAGVTNTYIRLGNAAANDKATSGNTALSATWQRITVTWTPTADYDDAHVAINIAAATGTTFEIDGVMVYEGTVAPTSVNQIEGRGGFPPLGVLEAENTVAAISASANYRSGFATAGPQIVVDPSLVTKDDYTQNDLAIEVWGRLEYDNTATFQTLYADPVSATSGVPRVYSEEFGGVGVRVVVPSSGTVRRFVRLGTLRLRTDTRYILAVSTSAATCDYFVLVPSNSRALSPSGKTTASFPSFVTATSEITRRIKADLSGTWIEPGTTPIAGPGLGGSLIEVPPGDIDFVVKLSNLVPDNPTVDTSTEQLSHSATVHLNVTPRWRLGRSA